MDFVTGLPKTKRGADAIQGHFSRGGAIKRLAVTTTTASATDAARLFISAVVRHHGVPASIVSDRDPKFVSRFWQAFWAGMGCTLPMSTAYHPQTDGRSERDQRTMEQWLRAFCLDHPEDWDLLIPLAELALNSVKQASTGHSPYYLLYGREPAHSVDRALQAAAPTALADNPAAAALHAQIQQAWLKARGLAVQAQTRMAASADKKRRDVVLKAGDMVLLANENIRFAERRSKLSPLFSGPFRVVRAVNRNAYELELPPRLAIHKVINISRLKLYRDGGAAFPDRPVPHARPPPDAVDSNGVESYVVDRIVAKRAGKYLVYWKGYPMEEATWERKAALAGAPDALRQFEALQAGDSGAAGGESSTDDNDEELAPLLLASGYLKRSLDLDDDDDGTEEEETAEQKRARACNCAGLRSARFQACPTSDFCSCRKIHKQCTGHCSCDPKGCLNRAAPASAADAAAATAAGAGMGVGTAMEAATATGAQAAAARHHRDKRGRATDAEAEESGLSGQAAAAGQTGTRDHKRARLYRDSAAAAAAGTEGAAVDDHAVAPWACDCSSFADSRRTCEERCSCAQRGHRCNIGCPCGPACNQPDSLAGLQARLDYTEEHSRQRDIAREQQRAAAEGPRSYCECKEPQGNWGCCGSSTQCSCVAQNLPCVQSVCGCSRLYCNDRGTGARPVLVTAKAAQDAAENVGRHIASTLLMRTAKDAAEAHDAGTEEPCQCGSTHRPPTGTHPYPRCCQSRRNCACRARGRKCTSRCHCAKGASASDKWDCRNGTEDSGSDSDKDVRVPDGAPRRASVITTRGPAGAGAAAKP